MALSDTTLRRLAWTMLGLSILGLLVGVALDLASGHISDYYFAAIVFTFPIVGIIVLTRRPRTLLGWLMLSLGVLFAIPGDQYAAYALQQDPPLPGAGLLLAPSNASWVPFICVSGFLLLLFPDGHLPSRRWGWFAWSCGIGSVLLYLVILLHPGPFDDLGFPDVENPLGLTAVGALGAWIYVFVVVAPTIVVGGAVAVIRRMRRTHDPVERQQLRWLAYAAGVIATLYVLAIVPSAVFAADEGDAWSSVLGSIAATSFALIPITIGIAILRYRLYEIDIVIRKTVVFAVVTVSIAVVYVAIVAGIGAAVGNASTPLLSALAAAIVALVFQPVRAWAHRVGDRLVYGERATPYEVMATFGDHLAGTYASEDVLPRLARVLGEGVGAERACVWLRIDDDQRAVATWPADALPGTMDDHTTEVRHAGEVLGALSIAMPANDALDPAREKLMDDLAAQAGLVLRNERLTEQLRARLDDLKAAQRRLVSAQDEERRRLERNIHDGAQQQLVALAVKARLARALTERDPAKAAEMLSQIEAETQGALEDLRDLARGIYPPLLADKGLPAALESQARKSALPVAVEADGPGRYPPEVEAAVYFSVLEALQNTAKYAEASRATVSLRRADGALTFSVSDDGRGFDTTTTGYGTGLQGIADRLGALDGEVRVRSEGGHGTTVTGRVPLDGRVEQVPA
jgi:signal transduction histidine kinase